MAARPESAWDDLLGVVARLRAEDGCPWDRAQTRRSLVPYLVEETYEVAEAVERSQPWAQCAELGDLLYLLLMMVRIAEEAGEYDLEQVAAGIAAKMRRRHPGILEPLDSGERFDGSAAAWEAAKARERQPGQSMMDGVPPALPSLLAAHRVGEKLSRVGFDWPDLQGVREKVREEWRELDEAVASGDEQAIQQEYGDLLLAVANMGRFLRVPPEEALREANRRFAGRFRVVERLAEERGMDLHGAELEELEALWQEAKREDEEEA